jgi:hypothetical protein
MASTIWKELHLLAVLLVVAVPAEAQSADQSTVVRFPFKAEGPVAAPKPSSEQVTLRCRPIASSSLSEVPQAWQSAADSDALLASTNDNYLPMASIVLAEGTASLSVDGSGSPAALPIVAQSEHFLVASGVGHQPPLQSATLIIDRQRGTAISTAVGWLDGGSLSIATHYVCKG